MVRQMLHPLRRSVSDRPATAWNERRTFTFFVLVSLIVAGAWVVYVITTMHDYAEQGARDRAGTEVSLVARMLNDRIAVRDAAVTAAAHEPGLVDVVRRAERHGTPMVYAELRRQLVVLGTRVPSLEEVTVVDAAGHLVESSRPLTVPRGTDLSRRAWFVGVLHDDPYTSGAVIGEETQHRVASTATSIKDADGQVLGYLMISGGPSTMQTAVDALAVNGSTDVFIVDTANMIVAGNGLADDELRSIGSFAGLRGTQDRRGAFLRRAGDFIVVQRPVEHSQWRVLVRMRISSAKHGFNRLARTILVTTSIAGAVWLAMASLVIRGLTRAELANVRLADADEAREKLAAVDDARMRERARIAEELHDTSLQLMNASLMQLDTAHSLELRRDDPAADQQRRAALGQTRTQLRDAIRGMRRILLGLAAIDVDHLELADAIELAARRATEAGGVDLDIELRRVNELEEPVRSLIYRLTSELVSNAVRHGRASCVRLRVAVEEGYVHVEVEDDGVGFPIEVHDMDDLPETVGLGLRTLARLHASGTIAGEVTSGPGRGVRYRLAMSVDRSELDGELHPPTDALIR